MMKDDYPHIIAECAKCGFRFDILFGVDCPSCRKEAVKQAFAPIDPLRTALGVQSESMREALNGAGVRWHGPEPSYMRGRRLVEQDIEEPEVPQGCKLPTDKAGQVYELKRMFRL